MFPAHLSDGPVAAHAGEHDLELLLHGPGKYSFSLNVILLQVERPILSGAPDAIRASPPPATRLRSRSGNPHSVPVNDPTGSGP